MVETVRRVASTGYVRNQFLVLTGGAGNGAAATANAAATPGAVQEIVGNYGSAEAVAVEAMVWRPRPEVYR